MDPKANSLLHPEAVETPQDPSAGTAQTGGQRAMEYHFQQGAVEAEQDQSHQLRVEQCVLPGKEALLTQ